MPVTCAGSSVAINFFYGDDGNVFGAVSAGDEREDFSGLVSGAHGTEYVFIIAIEKINRHTRPRASHRHHHPRSTHQHSVVLEQKVPHVNPVDNKSMNRFLPRQTRRHANGARLLPHHQGNRRPL